MATVHHRHAGPSRGGGASRAAPYAVAGALDGALPPATVADARAARSSRARHVALPASTISSSISSRTGCCSTRSCDNGRFLLRDLVEQVLLPGPADRSDAPGARAVRRGGPERAWDVSGLDARCLPQSAAASTPLLGTRLLALRMLLQQRSPGHA